MTTTILSRGRLRWLLGLALCTLAGLAAAVWSLHDVSLLPPRVEARQLQIAAASTHVRIDRPGGDIVDQGVTADDVAAIARRTVLLGRLMTSAPVLERVARSTGVPVRGIGSETQYEENVPVQMRDPESEMRAAAIANGKAPYQLVVQPRPNLPILDVYTQAPTAEGAQRLADAAAPALRDELRAEALARGADPARQVRLEQLGAASGGVINGTARPEI